MEAERVKIKIQRPTPPCEEEEEVLSPASAMTRTVANIGESVFFW